MTELSPLCVYFVYMWEVGAWGGPGAVFIFVFFDECDCAGAYMLPHFDNVALAPFCRSAGV